MKKGAKYKPNFESTDSDFDFLKQDSIGIGKCSVHKYIPLKKSNEIYKKRYSNGSTADALEKNKKKEKNHE